MATQPAKLPVDKAPHDDRTSMDEVVVRVSRGGWLAAGCTKPNPRSCQDGTCTEPGLPFCDVDGALAGDPQTCIAVDCMPGEFASCRGDRAIMCNLVGTDYELVQCSRGCDEAARGCRTCNPNETVCVNGTVQTCDADSNVTIDESCILGCFEDQPRCREIVPSNNLAAHIEMAAAGEPVLLENATLRIPSGAVTSPSGDFELSSQMVPVPDSPGSIQVFPVRSLTIVGVLRIVGDAGQPDLPAVAFTSYEEVEIDGSILLGGTGAPPGSVSSGPCVGSNGTFDAGGQPVWAGGGGGGGGATQGGAGGANWKWPGSSGGVAFPNADLQPLRGGCRGGGPTDQPAAHGGGALQITSRRRIRLGPNSTIQADGTPGFTGVSEPGEVPGDEKVAKGGGSGGGVLLEAPVVMLESGVRLSANGGGGASGDGKPASIATGTLPSTGGICVAPMSYCTNGGDGGSTFGPGRTASSIVTTNISQVYSGAGGGSVGHIRINTADGTYLRATDVVESPAASAAVVETR